MSFFPRPAPPPMETRFTVTLIHPDGSHQKLGVVQTALWRLGWWKPYARPLPEGEG